MHKDLAAQYRAYYTAYISEIERLTAICGAYAIDSVMGKEWFAKFKEQEVALEFKLATVKVDQKTIFNNDFQGIVKIFRFREEEGDVRNYLKSPVLITPVFDAFNLPRKERGRSVFSAICDTLIANRNLVHHLGLDAANTENAYELKGNIYFLKKAIIDCVTFLQYFKDVTDPKGRPYIDLVYQKIEELEKTCNIVRYHTLAVIKNEDLKITPEKFAEICQDLYITTAVIKGIYYFETNDYESDLRAIKTVLKSKSNVPVKKSRWPAVVLALSAVLVVVLVVIALLTGAGNTSGSGDFAPGNSANISADNGSQLDPEEDTTAQSTTEPTATTEPSTTTAPAVVKISGSATHDGLVFTVNQKLSNRFVIKVNNSDECDYAFGWVSPAEVVIETTTSTYFGKVDGYGNVKIMAGSSGQLVVNIEEDIEGEIESITLQNINALSKNGLPINGSQNGAVVDILISYVQ
ncbi:MAG: hypothetical protein IKU57_04585 [Oscillospiraceae bacterium]|nr:hypothetical protein [Oscillospiraceae bacterium]